MGAFGMYRGTRGMGALRLASRRLNPFPNTKLVRHKYCDTITIPAGGAIGAASVYQFVANNIYDPDYTGVGHQPLFHDEMAAQYKYYTVLTSSIKVTFAGTNAQEANFLLWVDDDLFVPTNPNDAMEQHASTFSLNRLDRRSNTLQLRASLDVARWNKTSRAGLLADDMHKTSRNSSPDAASRKYYQIYVAPLSSSVTLSAIPCKVELFYTVLWREPVDHTGS